MRRVADKTKNLSVPIVNMFQFSIAVFVSSVIIISTGGGGGNNNAGKNQAQIGAFEQVTSQVTRGDIIVGLFQFGSMNSSVFAMKYVSFPFVVLAKSAKVIPVILVGACRGVYKPTTKQYCIAFFISLGLFTFNFFKPSKKVSNKHKSTIYPSIYLLQPTSYNI